MEVVIMYINKALSMGLLNLLFLIATTDAMFSGISKYIPTVSAFAKKLTVSQASINSVSSPKNLLFHAVFLHQCIPESILFLKKTVF